MLCCTTQAAFAPADPPPVEEVPADAVDSAGKPVDSTLYTAFWKLQVWYGPYSEIVALRSRNHGGGLLDSNSCQRMWVLLAADIGAHCNAPPAVLAVHWQLCVVLCGPCDVALSLVVCPYGITQPLIQDATKVLKSPSEWDSLQSNLDIVLTGLAKSPATVAAVHAVGSSELAAATAAAAAADGSNGSSALYLSSYKLFGLQLADSAFRRGFLVQVRWCFLLRLLSCSSDGCSNIVLAEISHAKL